MKTLGEVNAEIARTKLELEQVRGTETEVYARIVGYYRSVRNWNKGKREEYNHRKMYGTTVRTPDNPVSPLTEERTDNVYGDPAVPTRLEPARLEVYTRKTCPNCPPISAYCSSVNMPVQWIDVDSHDGFVQAKDSSVRSAPTVILFDNNGRELTRAYSVNELKTLLPALV